MTIAIDLFKRIINAKMLIHAYILKLEHLQLRQQCFVEAAKYQSAAGLRSVKAQSVGTSSIAH